MNINEIINMVNEDLAEMSNEEYIDIDQLVFEYQNSLKNNDSQWIQILEKIRLIISTYDGMRQLLSAQDSLELSKVLIDIDRLRKKEVKNDSRSKLIDIAYLLDFRYFASHDMLERYFASVDIICILKRSGDNFAETYRAMAQWASKDTLVDSVIDPLDFHENNNVIFGQVLLAFAPYVLSMQQLYPNLVNHEIVDMCQKLVAGFPGTNEERQRLLPKMELLADFIEKEWKDWIRESNEKDLKQES